MKTNNNRRKIVNAKSHGLTLRPPKCRDENRTKVEALSKKGKAKLKVKLLQGTQSFRITKIDFSRFVRSNTYELAFSMLPSFV